MKPWGNARDAPPQLEITNCDFQVCELSRGCSLQGRSFEDHSRGHCGIVKNKTKKQQGKREGGRKERASRQELRRARVRILFSVQRRCNSMGRLRRALSCKRHQQRHLRSLHRLVRRQRQYRNLTTGASSFFYCRAKPRDKIRSAIPRGQTSKVGTAREQ